MKRILVAALLLSFALIAAAQEVVAEYDSTLAGKLGADELGMKTYVLVILKTGPEKTEDKELLDSLFRGHFSNMDRLAAEGRLVAAGPFYSNENQYRGLFLFDVRTIAEAEELVKSDPTVTNGIFVAEMYQWYGSAAIPLLNDLHLKIRKRNP